MINQLTIRPDSGCGRVGKLPIPSTRTKRKQIRQEKNVENRGTINRVNRIAHNYESRIPIKCNLGRLEYGQGMKSSSGK